MTNPHLPKATAALLFVSLMMLSTATSLAYNQTQTCNATGQYACEVGETPLPVYWPQRCIVYHINDQGTTDTDNEAAFQAIEDSFNQWSEPSCNNLKLTFGGFTNDDQVGYNQASPSDNANIIVFRDDNWPHSGGVLALTSVTFQPSTGKIFDADIELNTAEYRFSTTDNALRVGIDVANTLTHEAGHFLGLDHSGVSGSTMFATAPVGEVSKRDLAQDDIEGICSIYSSDTTAEDDACAGAPQGYFEKPPTTTQGNGTSSGTCGVLGTGAPTPPPSLIPLALLSIAATLTLKRR